MIHEFERPAELTLHLHSHLQVKAKNYDKVEKVRVAQLAS